MNIGNNLFNDHTIGSCAMQSFFMQLQCILHGHAGENGVRGTGLTKTLPVFLY